jgi:hypothetical protein
MHSIVCNTNLIVASVVQILPLRLCGCSSKEGRIVVGVMKGDCLAVGAGRADGGSCEFDADGAISYLWIIG